MGHSKKMLVEEQRERKTGRARDEYIQQMGYHDV